MINILAINLLLAGISFLLLLPHLGVALIFTGIAVETLAPMEGLQGTYIETLMKNILIILINTLHLLLLQIKVEVLKLKN